MTTHSIVAVSYRSTNYYAIGGAGRTRLLLDLGYPGTLGMMRAALDRKGIALTDITHGFATHYHPDHAGLAQEMKASGMTLLIAPEQLATAPAMKRWTKPEEHYVDVVLTDARTRVLPLSESRAYLSSIGLTGELVHTPGHSDDSVSLLLDDGSVFTGDLTHPMLIDTSIDTVTPQSWQTLYERGARLIYPGHGPTRPLKRLPE